MGQLAEKIQTTLAEHEVLKAQLEEALSEPKYQDFLGFLQTLEAEVKIISPDYSFSTTSEFQDETRTNPVIKSAIFYQGTKISELDTISEYTETKNGSGLRYEKCVIISPEDSEKSDMAQSTPTRRISFSTSPIEYKKIIEDVVAQQIIEHQKTL